MKVYRISAQNAQVEKSRALKRSAYTTAAAVMVGLFLGGRGFFQEHDLVVLLVWGGFGAGLVVFGVWLSLPGCLCAGRAAFWPTPIPVSRSRPMTKRGRRNKKTLRM